MNLWPVTQKEFFEFFGILFTDSINLSQCHARLRLRNFGSSMHAPVIVLVWLPAQQPPKPLTYEIMAQSHNTKVLWLTKKNCSVVVEFSHLWTIIAVYSLDSK